IGDRLVSPLAHKLEPEVTTVHRLEVITGAGRRRRFTEAFKARVVEETLTYSRRDRFRGCPAEWPDAATSVHVASASAQGGAAADRERSPDVRAGRCGNGIAIPV